MQQIFHITRLLIIPLLLMGIHSCSGENCSINNTVQGKLAFYDQAGNAVAFTNALTVKVARPQGDSIVLNQSTYTSEVIFPLSYAYTTDTLIFDYNNGSELDSIYINHSNIPTLVSIDCGTAMFHTITSVSSTHNLKEAIILNSPEVDYDECENIKVICPIAN